MHLLEVRLFGEFAATDHRRNPLAMGNKRTQALLIYLALRMDEGGKIEEIGRLFFDHADDATHISHLIGDLRHALRHLSQELVIVDGESVRLNPALVTVDALRFADLAERSSINSIREAADLYGGNLLEGYFSGSRRFDDWLAEQRGLYGRIAVAVLGRLLAVQIKAAWWEAAVDTASRLLSLDPSQEVVHRTLIRLQLEQGRPDSALRRYQECVDILKREFNRAPSAETQRLHDEIITTLERSPAPREVFRAANERPVLVLLLEDDAVSSALVEGFLTEAGYAVVPVADGADALFEIGRHEFDLLILDINVPTLSGLRLFEIMIQKGIDTPAVFITGIAGAEEEARSLEMGAADFLRKPIRKETLLPRIRTILQRRTRAAQKP
jgi:DNA-binding SARP family transcriptional activator